MSHVPEKRRLVRRLGRRARPSQAQSLRQQTRRPQATNRNAQPLEARAPSAPYATAQAIAEAWAASTKEPHSLYAAKELAAELTANPDQPYIAVARLIATWKTNLAPNTVYHRIAQLRRITDAIDRQIRSDLRSLVKLPKRPPPRAVILTEKESDALWHAAPAHMKMFLALAGDLALRFAEASSVGWSNWNPQQKTVTVKTKGGSVKTFPVTPAIEALIEMCPPDVENFLDGLAGKRISPAHIRYQWEKLKQRAGVRPEVIPHDLRRTAAVRVYQLTHDVLAAKQLLGHEQLSSTALYLKAHEPRAMKELTDSWFNRTRGPKQ